jgi:probable phosphoglycerate mutase
LKGIYAGQLDAPLTEKGFAQAETLREKLAGIKFDRVYSSDLSRAMNTARTALPGVEFTTDARLREISVGSLAGQIAKDFRAQNPDKLEKLRVRDFTEFGGECESDVMRRLSEFLSELSREELSTVAVFCHGGVICAALGVALGVELSHYKVAQPNCMVSVFELDGDFFGLESWNI